MKEPQERYYIAYGSNLHKEQMSRRCPEARAAYGALKRALAARFPYDIEGYCDGKDAFVRELEAKALAECGAGPFFEE